MILQRNLSVFMAVVVVGGHILVFVYGFVVLGILSGEYSTDMLQIILMASPVLGASATTAFKFVLEDGPSSFGDAKITLSASALILIGPVFLIAAIFCLFTLTYYRYDDFSIDGLKVSLGIVETFYAVFLTAVSEKLFLAPDRRTRRPRKAKLPQV